MMKKLLPLFLFLFSLSSFKTFANIYPTPGTGVNWTLNDLVLNSGGHLISIDGMYHFQDSITISNGDTLSILTNETVKFAAGTFLQVLGVLIIDPPTEVLFTAQDSLNQFKGIRLDSTVGNIFRNLRFEYGNAIRFFDSEATIESSTFRRNTMVTSWGRGVLEFSRTKALINNCTFTDNHRSPISSGANVENALRITGCFFARNNITFNENRPQIVLGPSAMDTIFILNNTFHQAAVRSGAIGFLPIGTVHTVITGNTILNNRYGILLQGGSNINALVSYNHIEGNNIEGNPNLGGSGISFVGGAAGNHQNSIVTGNLFKNNLWGITIQNRARPNLGNLLNADTTDDGKNHFVNNTNAGVPGIDLYNNTVDPIDAQGNYWYTDNPLEVESKIFHQADNPSLGLVNYSNFLLPVHLLSFEATAIQNKVLLQWETAHEANSSHFEIERSENGTDFVQIGSVNATGNSSTTLQYGYEDNSLLQSNGTFFYRLKMVDDNQHFVYSSIRSVVLNNLEKNQIRIYPTHIAQVSSVRAELMSDKAQPITIRFVGADGKTLHTSQQQLNSGFNSFNIDLPRHLPNGNIFIQLQLENNQKTIPLSNTK